MSEHDHKQVKIHFDHKEKKTLKGILHDALHQLIASAIILVVGIVLMNIGSYTKIIKHKWQTVFGDGTSQLEQIITTDTKKTSATLTTSSNPNVQKRQIPPLDIEVAPSDNRLIIPRINENIPVVRVSSDSLIRRDWAALESEMQEALRGGVVHYPGTSVPGQKGNIAITGHSSYFPWDPGRFKDVFALLHDVVEGDKIIMYWDQKKYVYEISDIKVVLPEDIEVLKQTPDDRLTLITCTPIGTNLKRLIIQATPVEVKADANGVLR